MLLPSHVLAEPVKGSDSGSVRGLTGAELRGGHRPGQAPGERHGLRKGEGKRELARQM